MADSLSLDNRTESWPLSTIPTFAPDARERRLKSRFPQQYRILLNEVYPALRHSDYEVEYVVRPFSLEEARVILTENPRLLSLHELYMIANSYEPGSDEFNGCSRWLCACSPPTLWQTLMPRLRLSTGAISPRRSAIWPKPETIRRLPLCARPLKNRKLFPE